jgi:hypothetical protein
MHLQTGDVANIGKLIVKGDVGNGRLPFEADVLILILLPALSAAIVRIAQSRAISLRRIDDPPHISPIEEAAPKTAYASVAARQVERAAAASEL